MDWEKRISADATILTGKPVITGTRNSVELVVELLEQGWSERQILDNYPSLTTEDIRACLAYAKELLTTERAFPLKAS